MQQLSYCAFLVPYSIWNSRTLLGWSVCPSVCMYVSQSVCPPPQCRHLVDTQSTPSRHCTGGGTDIHTDGRTDRQTNPVEFQSSICYMELKTRQNQSKPLDIPPFLEVNEGIKSQGTECPPLAQLRLMPRFSEVIEPFPGTVTNCYKYLSF